MKKLFLVMLMLLMVTTNAYAIQPVKVTVDGKQVSAAGQEAIYNSTEGLVLIPLRAVCEAIGAEVKWDAAGQTATVKLMNKSVEIPVNSSMIKVNGKSVDIKAKAVLMNNKTMVPMEFMQQALGSKLNWNKAQNSLSISDRNVKLKMSSTIGPIDAGIVGTLAQKFEEKTGVNVEYIGAGTGKALDMAKSGDYDVVLVHAKALEEQFVADGYGTKRIPVMYNDFLILGPAGDPAGIKGLPVIDALKQLTKGKAKFISRGDNSGTHVKEKELWTAAGVKPEGDWYVVWEGGSKGNSATLKYTNEQQAYTIMDRATYLTVKKDISLVPLVQGEESLLNFISIIPVNSQKFSQVNQKLAADFIKFITSEEGQVIIRDFKKNEYGEPLFFPNSEEWKALPKPATPAAPTPSSGVSTTPAKAPVLSAIEVTSKGDVSLTLDKDIAIPAAAVMADACSQFTVKVGGTASSVSSIESTNTAGKIKLVMSKKIAAGQVVTIAYTKNANSDVQLKAKDGGVLDNFADRPIQ